MKHITWLLVVLTLALGCGRDKKAWAQKIDTLVQRAYACTDVACAKAVEEEMGKIVGSDDGRNLDEGEPEYMFNSAKRIKNRVAELEYEATRAKERASSPLTALDVFEATLSACQLAYVDLRDPVRARVEQTIGKVGATLPADVAPGAKGPGGLFWHDEFVKVFGAAMKGKVPKEDALHAGLVNDLCILNFRYEAGPAKDKNAFGAVIDHLAELSELLGHQEHTKELIAAVRRAAPDEEVIKTTGATVKAIRAALAK